MTGEYPLATLRFPDPDLPVQIEADHVVVTLTTPLVLNAGETLTISLA